MLPFASAVLCAALLQSAGPSSIDLNAVTKQLATFVNAFNEKDYFKSDFQIGPLVEKCIELGNATTAADAAKLALLALSLEHVTSVPESQAAAHAMGEYFGEKEELRKRIVGKLILACESAGTGQNSSSIGGPRQIVVDPQVIMQIHYEFSVALARLAGGVQYDSAQAWGDWYRDAKSAKWKDGVDKVSVKADGSADCPVPTRPEQH